MRRNHRELAYWGSTLLAVFGVFCFSTLALADTNAAFSDVITRIRQHEDAVVSVRMELTEHYINHDDPTANVVRHYRVEEQGELYRLEITYPEIKTPPFVRGNAKMTYGYTPVTTTWDGERLMHHIPDARTAMVASTRVVGQLDEFPATNRRPLWPYSIKRLSVFLASEAGTKDTTSLIAATSDPNVIQVTVVNGQYRFVAAIDKAKGFALTDLQMFYKERLGDHRTFGDFRQYDGIWIPRQSQVERFHSRDGHLANVAVCVTDSLVVNIPLPPDRFRLTFPDGTTVKDMIQGRQYRVDSREVDREVDKSIASIDKSAAFAGLSPTTRPVSSPSASAAHQGNAMPTTQEVSPLAYVATSADWLRLLWKPLAFLFAVLLSGAVLRWWVRDNPTRASRPRLLMAGACAWGIASTAGGVYLYMAYTSGLVGPSIYSPTNVLDLGTISADQEKQFDVPIHNRGTAELTIASIRKSCTCSAAEMSQTKIAPGCDATLHVRYSPTPSQKNEFHQTVVLVSNDPRQRELNIRFRGVSVPRVLVTPVRTSLFTVRRSTTTLVDFTLLDPPGEMLSASKEAFAQTDEVRRR